MLPASLTSFNLTYLRIEKTGAIDEFFQNLPAFQLKELRCNLTSLTNDPDYPVATAAFAPFLASQTQIQLLHLRCDSLLPNVIAALSNLTKLRNFDFWWNHGLAMSPDILQRLAEATPSVEVLKFGWQPWMAGYWPIDPFLLWNLVDVELRGYPTLGYGKHDLERMAKAWPRLARLDINGPGVHEHIPLSTLDRIATLFPNLVDLNILLDIKMKLDTLPTPEGRFHHLKRLRVCDWVVPEAAIPKVADYIATLCPGNQVVLDYAKVDRGLFLQIEADAREVRNRWKDVEILVNRHAEWK